MKRFLACLLVLSLAGCAVDPVSTITMGTGTIVSYNLAGKSPMDLAASQATGKDCDSLKAAERGAYCVENGLKQNPYFTAANNPPVYCFRTMGDVECYASPDPHANNANPIYRGKARASAAPAASYEAPAVPVPAPATLPKAPVPEKPKQLPAKAAPTSILPPEKQGS